MRFRVVVCIAVLLLVSPAVFAQSNRVSVYLSDPGMVGGDYFDRHYTGGAGVSLNHFWSPRFSTEIAASAMRDYSGIVYFNHDGSVREKQEFGYTLYPIDIVAQYHFRTDSRLKPYIGAGMSYSNRPMPYRTGSKFTAEANGGMFIALKPRFGIVVDGRLSDSGTAWFPDFRPSVGLSWKF